MDGTKSLIYPGEKFPTVLKIVKSKQCTPKIQWSDIHGVFFHFKREKPGGQKGLEMPNNSKN